MRQAPDFENTGTEYMSEMSSTSSIAGSCSGTRFRNSREDRGSGFWSNDTLSWKSNSPVISTPASSVTLGSRNGPL